MLRGVVILACALVACGGATKPGATVTGSARPAVAADAIDADAPFRLGVDFATLRKIGWHDVVADVVARMSDHDSWSALQRDCRFVLRRDARTVEESSDERGERIVAVEPLEPLDDKLACIRSTVREGFFTTQQMTKLGRARAEVVEGLLLIGSERAIREAKRRLGVDRESTPPRQRLLWLSIEKTENETYTLLVTRYIGRRTIEGFKEVVDAELQRADALLRSGTPLKKVYESLSAAP